MGRIAVCSIRSPRLCFMGVCDPLPVDVDRFNRIHVVLFTDADYFEPKEPTKKATTMDKWEGEDEDEDVKVNEAVVAG